MTLVQYLFETGPQGTSLTNGNSGSSGASMGAGSTGIFDAAVAAHGAFGAKLTNGAGVNAYRLFPMAATNTNWQMSGVITVPSSAPAANVTVGQAYNSGGSGRVSLYVDTSLRLGISGSGGATPTLISPALTPGGQYRVTLQVQGGSATASVVTAKVYSKTGGAWNTQLGTTYNSTTFNAGTDAVVGFSVGIVNSPATTISVGWDDLQLNDGAGSEIGDIVTALPEPTITVGTITDPSTVGGTDGSVRVSWPAVSGAGGYSAWRAPGHDAADNTLVQVSPSVTSPYDFTGLAGGNYTVAIRSEP